MPVFPSTLPAPRVEGYGITAESPIKRTQMERGTPRVRRQFSTTPSRMTVIWKFSLAQMAAFDSWHKYTVLDGSAAFDIALASGMGIQAMEARFVGQPKKSALAGLNWNVSAELEVRNMPIMPQDYIELAAAYSPDDLSYSSGVLHTLVNTTLPSANYW